MNEAQFEDGAAMTPMQQDDEDSTLAVMAASFARLVQHGMGRDEQVQRMSHELRVLYRGQRRAEEQRHFERMKWEDILRKMDELEAVIAHRDSLLMQAHDALTLLDPGNVSRMSPTSTRLQFQKAANAFLEAYRQTLAPPAPSQAEPFIVHSHGSHGEHRHTETEYAKHQRPIDDEVKVLREPDAPAPVPDDATIKRLREESLAARKALRDANMAQRLERKRQYHESMKASAPAVRNEDELEEEDEDDGI